MVMQQEKQKDTWEKKHASKKKKTSQKTNSRTNRRGKNHVQCGDKVK